MISFHNTLLNSPNKDFQKVIPDDAFVQLGTKKVHFQQ